MSLGEAAGWLAVLAVSLVLVIGLILFLESRDQSSVEGALGGVEAGVGRWWPA